MTLAVERRPATGDELLERALVDFEWYCENVLEIEDKATQKYVPFTWKPVQRRLARVVLEEWAAGKPVRLIILKARREGVSTLIQAFMFWICATRSYRNSMTIAQDDETTGTLFGMTERFYERMPPAFRPLRRTAKRGHTLEFASPSKNVDEQRKNPGLNSLMRTVSQKNAGAGKGVTLFHGSEVALYPREQAKKTLDTALQTIPRSAETAVFLESTARGLGNEYHRRWRQAEMGVSEYIPFFIPWFEEPTNRADPPAAFAPTQEETLLAGEYGLDDQQLFWRRLTIENECGGDIDTFHQEYPSTPEEAFLSTGRPYFEQRSIKRYHDMAATQEPWRRGTLVEEDRDGTLYAIFKADRRGPLKVWEAPQHLEDYLIFCDASEGSEGDYQAIYVFPRSRMGIVAGWHGRVDRDLLGDELYKLGRLYNDALIAVEVTGGWGLVPVYRLKNRGYPRLYKSATVDRRSNKRKVSLGWKTTVETRALALDTLNRAVRDGSLECFDPDLFVEMSTFVYDENGKPQAEEGCYDDRVITAAGGCFLWETEPFRTLTDETEPKRQPLSAVSGY